MALILEVNGYTPKFGEGCFLADNATLTGDVICGNGCSFWFNTVVRGDVHEIRIGNRVNVQDGAVIHATYQRANCVIEDDVSIGHRAIVHGCRVKSSVLIGMGAIIMDHVVIESNVLVAAGAVVTQGKHLESGYVYGGIPAKKLKPLDSNLKEGEIQRIAQNYIKYASWYNK